MPHCPSVRPACLHAGRKKTRLQLEEERAQTDAEIKERHSRGNKPGRRRGGGGGGGDEEEDSEECDGAKELSNKHTAAFAAKILTTVDEGKLG